MQIQNRPFDQIAPGDMASRRRLITADDLFVYAAASGNYNPAHLPSEDLDGDGIKERAAPGAFVASLISGILGTQLPGPGTRLCHQTLDFHTRAHAGEEVLAQVRVLTKSRAADGSPRVRLAVEVTRPADGTRILTGEVEVEAPIAAFAADVELPGLVVERHRHFEALLDRARPLPALPTAVVCPEDDKSLDGALRAAQDSLIVPILIGDPARIAAAAASIGADLSPWELIPAAHHEAAALACALVHQGRAQAVMKGQLHTEDLLRPMLDKDKGLRIGRRFTHVFVMDVPGVDHPLMVTDAAINIAPDLATKVDIVQNAIDLALSLGMPPRVGVLSAVETVTPAIQSSIDAALLSKMAERGQITGGDVDGPLAMDNAVDLGAARTKGLKGGVAGRANILVVPGIDAGNMLAKQLAYISHAEGAGLVLGARVPVILNSRSDSAMSRLASCAVAAIHHFAGAK